MSLGSMVALKATVFEKQQEAKRFKANPAERKLQVLEDIVDFSFFFSYIFDWPLSEKETTKEE